MDRQALEQYKKPTGFYDITAIIEAEQPDNEHAFFTAFFGGGADDPDRDNESDLVRLARELNAQFAEEKRATDAREVEALTAELETADTKRRHEIFNRLVALGAGQWLGDADDLHFELNRSHGSPYADQAGLEENAPHYRL